MSSSSWRVLAEVVEDPPDQGEPEPEPQPPKKVGSRAKKAEKDAYADALRKHEEELVRWEERERRRASSVGGMVIYVTDGSVKHEVSRVGFNREFSANPNRSFQETLNEELEKAREAARIINETLTQFDGSMK